MAKIVCVLYVERLDGYPKSYCSNLLKIAHYPGEKSVLAPGAESVPSGKLIFDPHLETEAPEWLPLQGAANGVTIFMVDLDSNCLRYLRTHRAGVVVCEPVVDAASARRSGVP